MLRVLSARVYVMDALVVVETRCTQMLDDGHPCGKASTHGVILVNSGNDCMAVFACDGHRAWFESLLSNLGVGNAKR